MTGREKRIKEFNEYEQKMASMSAEDMKADLLENCELSFQDSRLLKRKLPDTAIRRMYKKYYPFVDNAEDGFNFIMRKHDALLKSVNEMFDIEEYGCNFFERLNYAAQFNKNDLAELEKERLDFLSDRSVEILNEFNSKFSYNEVYEYAGDSLNFGCALKNGGYSVTFSEAFSNLKTWSEK